MISTIPPGRCIQTQGTEPFQYGPEVYRSYWRLSSALEHWLALVAQRDPEVIVEEGGAPAAKDIAELMELHRSIGLWLFEGHHYNVLNVRLLREAVEAGRKWQKGLPWRTYVIDRTDDLRCAVEAYEDSSSNPGTVFKRTPLSNQACTLSAPQTSSV